MIAKPLRGWIVATALLNAVPMAHAQDLPNFGKIVLCKQMTNDAERLQCFDRAVNEAPNEFVSKDSRTTAEGDWKLTEITSQIDGRPRLAAVLESAEGNSALVVRCHDRITEAYVSLRTYIGAAEALPVTYRIDDAAPIDARWMPSRDGSALFLANPALAVRFFRSLPADATLRLRVHDFQGRSGEFTFALGPIDEVRDRIAAACNWPADERQPEAAAAPPRDQARAQPPPRRTATKLVSVPLHHQRWNISAQRR
jgi:hypothetical protein